MHRHAYKGRKLQLAAGPRKALVRGLVTSLVLHEQIETTVARAKEIRPVFEKLVTTAKKGSVASGRSLRQSLLTENAAQKMLQELVPAWKDRQGGYTRIIKTGYRQGDSAPMAIISLVLPEKLIKPAADEIPAEAAKPAKPAATKKPAAASAKPAKRSRAPKAAVKEAK